MNLRRPLAVAALACAASVLASVPAAAIMILRTPPAPTMTATETSGVSGIFYDQIWSFSGSDFCGDAVRTEFNGHISPYSVTCGHNVFVGLWAPGPTGGGSWMQSTTLVSSAGGTGLASVSGVGEVSGSFTVTCGGPNMELYAYDLDQGTVLAAASVPSFGCVIHRIIR
jgi:hypothetical protein